jgi:hypothetical protein
MKPGPDYNVTLRPQPNVDGVGDFEGKQRPTDGGGNGTRVLMKLDANQWAIGNADDCTDRQ